MAQGTVEKVEEGTLPAGKSGKLQQAAFLSGSQSLVVFFFCNGLAAESSFFRKVLKRFGDRLRAAHPFCNFIKEQDSVDSIRIGRFLPASFHQ